MNPMPELSEAANWSEIPDHLCLPIRPPIPASAKGKHIIGKLEILNLDARDTL